MASKHVFTQPKKILQVVLQERHWDKTTYRNLPSRRVDWLTELETQNGFIEANQLFLPEELFVNTEFAQADSLVLFNSLKIKYLRIKSRVESLNLFLKLRWLDSQIWLEFVADKYNLQLGYPSRNDFAISPLKVNQPINFLINGKTWHSMSSRRQSNYHEHNIWLEYLGEFEECNLLKIKDLKKTKKLDFENAKVIDVRKELF